jgi:hypothetical protein
MRPSSRFAVAIAAAVAAAVAVAAAIAMPAAAHAAASAPASPEPAMHPHHAEGAFDVRLAPQPVTPGAQGAGLARQSIAKRFHGELEAESDGEMLAYQRQAYVALEKVTGTLGGRRGSFVLLHRATMVDGRPTLEIDVVPGSATGELQGLIGRLGIAIAPDGAHAYRFDYALPEAPVR